MRLLISRHENEKQRHSRPNGPKLSRSRRQGAVESNEGKNEGTVVHGALRHPESHENGPTAERRRLAAILGLRRARKYRRADGALRIAEIPARAKYPIEVKVVAYQFGGAAERLAGEGIEEEVLDPRTLVPLDKQLILDSVRKTEHVVIVQEAVRRGGIASDIASIIQEEAFDYLDAPIEIVAGKNTPIPFNLNLESVCVPQEEDIVRAIKRAVYATD